MRQQAFLGGIPGTINAVEQYCIIRRDLQFPTFLPCFTKEVEDVMGPGRLLAFLYDQGFQCLLHTLLAVIARGAEFAINKQQFRALQMLSGILKPRLRQIARVKTLAFLGYFVTLIASSNASSNGKKCGSGWG